MTPQEKAAAIRKGRIAYYNLVIIRGFMVSPYIWDQMPLLVNGEPKDPPDPDAPKPFKRFQNSEVGDDA